MQIINEIEGGKTKSDVSRQMGLASSTVATIWKNRDNIVNAYGGGDNAAFVSPLLDEELNKLKECLPPEGCRPSAAPSPSKMTLAEVGPMVGLTELVSGTNKLFCAYHHYPSSSSVIVTHLP